MSTEELYFKHPETGQLLPDKRTNKIEYTLAKIELTINTLERGVEARLGSFETLLRERLDYQGKQVSQIQDESNELVEALETSLKTFANSSIEKQKIYNKNFNDRIINLEGNCKLVRERVEVLEHKPVRNKAAIIDKLVYGIGGLLLAFILSNFQKLLEGLGAFFR
jgi:hypothetical protein